LDILNEEDLNPVKTGQENILVINFISHNDTYDSLLKALATSK